MKKSFPALVLLILLNLSCKDTESVSFIEPQPADMSDLTAIPAKFHGSYRSASDSVIVSVDKTVVVITHEGDLTVHKNDLSKDEYFSDGYLHDRSTNEKAPAVINGDSIAVHIAYSDTIFDTSNDILRKSNGALFFNMEVQPGRWSVKKVSLHGKSLRIDRISDTEAKEVPFDKIAADSSAQPLYSSTKRQFKSFVRKGGFKDGQQYDRISQVSVP